MLSKETLKELSAILLEEFNENLTDQEVFEVGQSLVGFFDELSRLDAKDKNDNEAKRMHKTI